MKEEIYKYLVHNCRGKENLIKNKELRNLFGINSDRALRKIIQEIRQSKDFREVVGSLSGKSGGFYICITEEEIKETINNIKHRANQMLRMVHIIEWKEDLYNEKSSNIMVS